MTTAADQPWLDPDCPLEDRIDALVKALELTEKIGQLSWSSPAVERLGIPAYNWWNECLHGVARAGRATVFPQSIGLAASFNPHLVERIGSVIADEARAKHHDAIRLDNRAQYLGLTFWTPNINIVRDPRWGRGQETYGECPWLTGQLGMALVRGLQGDDPKYLKTAACAKHYAVHSGPENERHSFDAKAGRKDMFETYLPAFRDLVVETRVETVMGAYNRTNGEPCCASPTLLQDILRDRWGFQGHVVSDCGAIRDFHSGHHVTATWEESAALAVKEGCDLNCGDAYTHLREAHMLGLIDEAAIDVALRRVLRTRFRLGMFDPPERVPYASIPPEVVNCDKHRALAREAARQSIVLLKNDGILPLSRDLRKVWVVGPNADSTAMLLGNYNGYSPRMVSVLEGILAQVRPGTVIDYAQGCDLLGRNAIDDTRLSWMMENTELIIAVMGLTVDLEGEEGDGAMSDAGGDRAKLGLPDGQTALVQRLLDLGKPLVLVLGSGSALTIPDLHERANAVVQAWYPGEEGGNAVGEVLFGETSPAGRLPVTVVQSMDQLPDFRDYSMVGRTYRYQQDEPLYPFGFGLSYSQFAYENLRLDHDELPTGESVTVTVTVRNTGDRPADEVVQLYLTALEAPFRVPRCQLRGVEREYLAPGASRDFTYTLGSRELALVNEDGDDVVLPGRYRVEVGPCSPGGRGQALGAPNGLATEFTLIE